MKLAWSPEKASKAYIDSVKSGEILHESGVAALVSAMAAGWNAKLIVETWLQGGVISTSMGLAIASGHTGGQKMGENGVSAEVMVGEAEEVMNGLVGTDFLVVDSRRKDFARFLRLAKLSTVGAMLVCKNANSRTASTFKWRCVLGEGSRRLVRSVFLPVGKGLDIAYV